MTVIIQLSAVGINITLFDIYSNIDYGTPIVTGISKMQLLAGYSLLNVPNNATTIRLSSTGTCSTYTDIAIGGLTTTTTTTSTTAIPTTTTTTLNCSFIVNAQEITTTTTTTTTVISYTVGQAALGGIIAYILQPGDPDYVEGEQNGIVVTTTDVSTSALWGCEPTEILGADGTALGTGKQNTISIMAGCPTAGIAARLCGNLIEGGYSDWFLPSKDELNKVWLNRVAIGGLSIFEYWTSSEYSNFQAWFQSFASGGTMSFAAKSNLFRVRAVRSF